MESNIPHYVYALVNPRNHYPFYIGITSSLEDRYVQHLESQEGKKRASIVSSLADVGLKPAIIVLERKPSRKQAKLAEIFWIELFGSRGIPIVNKEILGGIDSVNFHIEPPITPKRRLKQTSEVQAYSTELTRQKQHKNKTLPENHGKAWQQTDIESLIAAFASGSTIEQLAEIFSRTYFGILGQLQRLATSNEAVYGRLAELGLLKSQEAYRHLAS